MTHSKAGTKMRVLTLVRWSLPAGMAWGAALLGRLIGHLP
jgi:hypothetical protein